MKKTKPLMMPAAALENLRARLKTLPPKPRVTHTARETVATLKSEILHAVEMQGYSIADIAEIYRDLGYPIAPGTLATYLRDARSATMPPMTRPRGNVPRKGAPRASARGMPASGNTEEDDHLVRTFLREGEH